MTQTRTTKWLIELIRSLICSSLRCRYTCVRSLRACLLQGSEEGAALRWGKVCRVPRGSVTLYLPLLPPSSNSYSPLTSLLLRPRAQSCRVRRRTDGRTALTLRPPRPTDGLRWVSATRRGHGLGGGSSEASPEHEGSGRCRRALARPLNLCFSCSPPSLSLFLSIPSSLFPSPEASGESTLRARSSGLR